MNVAFSAFWRNLQLSSTNYVTFSTSTEMVVPANLHPLAEQVRRAADPRCLDLHRFPANECRNRHLQFSSFFFVWAKR